MKIERCAFAVLLLSLAAVLPCRAAGNKPAPPADVAGAPLRGGARDLHTNFYVSLPAKRQPIPEPLAPGQRPGFKFRGTKGWAWTPEQYLAEIPFLVKFKMNFLMNCYLSMFDLEHHPDFARDQQANRWWEDLPQTKMKAYENIVRECQRQGIQFCFSMNPDLLSTRMVNDESPDSVELLYKHYAWMQSLGVKWFNLSLDDIRQGINPSSQAKVANEIFHRLRVRDPEARMIFCPTYYWGIGAGDKQQPYLEVLARELDKDVYMFWTGDDCVGPVTRRGAETFRRISGHPLFLWDNYPVNDDCPTMNLGPVVDRDADLCEVIDGYMSNPMRTQNQINRIPLATCADYAYNPRAYDPARSIGQAILNLGATPAQCEALRDLVEAYPGTLLSSQHDTMFNSVQAVFDRLLTAPRSRQAALAYLEHLQCLSARLKKEFPGRYQPAEQTLDHDIQTAARKLAAQYP
jgi:hyaluronoglucosaminidase